MARTVFYRQCRLVRELQVGTARQTSWPPGPDGQAVGCNPTIKQVRLLPASLAPSGVAQSVRAPR